jgi:hypothetical protein
MGRVDLGAANDLGLVSVLPLPMYLGLALLAVAFAGMLARDAFPTWLAVGLVVLTIAMLYGITPVIEGELRFAPSWRHLGLVEFMGREGIVKPTLDAYHNWPGLFGLVALVSAVTGVTDLVGLATRAPIWLSLAYLVPLILVISAFTDDRRILWLSVWLFYLTDWIGQDYFAPQAVGFFLFLVAFATFLRWLGHIERPDRPAKWRRAVLPRAQVPGSSAGRRPDAGGVTATEPRGADGHPARDLHLRRRLASADAVLHRGRYQRVVPRATVPWGRCPS